MTTPEQDINLPHHGDEVDVLPRPTYYKGGHCTIPKPFVTYPSTFHGRPERFMVDEEIKISHSPSLYLEPLWLVCKQGANIHTLVAIGKRSRINELLSALIEQLIEGDGCSKNCLIYIELEIKCTIRVSNIWLSDFCPLGTLMSSTRSPLPPTPRHLLRSHSSSLTAVAWSDDNERIYSADSSGKVVVTSSGSLRPITAWNAHTDSVLGVEEWDGYIITLVTASHHE